MPPHPTTDLRDLLASFEPDLPPALLDALRSHLDHGEPALALEELSTAIYEHDLPVDPRREARFLALSEAFDVDPSVHAFIGRTPPYPDLRTPEQRELGALLDREPSLDTVAELARQGLKIPAVRAYRQLTGASLAEAVAAVEALEQGRPPPSEADSPPTTRAGQLLAWLHRHRRRLLLASLACLLLFVCSGIGGSILLMDYEDKLTQIDEDTWKRASMHGIHRVGFEVAFVLTPALFWSAVLLLVGAVTGWWTGGGRSSAERADQDPPTG